MTLIGFAKRISFDASMMMLAKAKLFTFILDTKPSYLDTNCIKLAFIDLLTFILSKCVFMRYDNNRKRMQYI